MTYGIKTRRNEVFSFTGVKAELSEVLHYYNHWFCLISFLGMIFKISALRLLFILQNSVGMCVYKYYSNLCYIELILVLQIVFNKVDIYVFLHNWKSIAFTHDKQLDLVWFLTNNLFSRKFSIFHSLLTFVIAEHYKVGPIFALP